MENTETVTNLNDTINGTDDTDQYLTFIMNDEEYGVDILSVQEIRGWEPCTQIPNAPRFLKGVINLRGIIVPIVDLRLRFQLQEVPYSPTTVVIVLKLPTEKGDRITGIVVDAVSTVYGFSPDDIKEPPRMGESLDTNFISGLINVNGKMVILLELESLLDFDMIPSEEELRQLQPGR